MHRNPDISPPRAGGDILHRHGRYHDLDYEFRLAESPAKLFKTSLDPLTLNILSDSIASMAYPICMGVLC
jgi:hypothetical protein